MGLLFPVPGTEIVLSMLSPDLAESIPDLRSLSVALGVPFGRGKFENGRSFIGRVRERIADNRRRAKEADDAAREAAFPPGTALPWPAFLARGLLGMAALFSGLFVMVWMAAIAVQWLDNGEIPDGLVGWDWFAFSLPFLVYVLWHGASVLKAYFGRMSSRRMALTEWAALSLFGGVGLVIAILLVMGRWAGAVDIFRVLIPVAAVILALDSVEARGDD